MRWSFFHLCLCALLTVQQPTLLISSSRWAPPAGAVSAQGASNGQLPDEEEEKIQGVRLACRGLQRQGASREREHFPVPARPVRRESASPVPLGSDEAVAHWRAVMLPPPSQPDEPPQRV